MIIYPQILNRPKSKIREHLLIRYDARKPLLFYIYIYIYRRILKHPPVREFAGFSYTIYNKVSLTFFRRKGCNRPALLIVYKHKHSFTVHSH